LPRPNAPRNANAFAPRNYQLLIGHFQNSMLLCWFKEERIVIQKIPVGFYNNNNNKH
jgi:hypothetical protein